EAEIQLYSHAAPLGESLRTNESSQVRVDLVSQTIDAFRVKVVEKTPGTENGQAFQEVRHYLTVTFPPMSYHQLHTTMPYPAMPEPVTSFGAAVLNNSAYYYGGHTGNAHEYSDDGQGKTLFRLELKPGSEWESLEKGPGLQGLALVALNGKLYRMGGFTAKNKAGEDHDLWSQDDFAAYDPKTNRWEDLPALPEPRSSFDAAVLDGKIYIVGGWMLAGAGEESWHQTAWRIDPANIEAGWEQLPTPPFQKRALSVAAFDGKLYAIGGMTSEGQPTREVSIYSPQTQQWERGPALLGHGMTGFGTSAFAQAGALYVSAFDGTLQRLSAEETKWELIGQFENARFFHRMLPVGDQQLLILGGSNMSVGIFDEPELLDLSKQN
ncbi:MAG: hypothetical protein KDA78_21320, partial [Planctomycetaceae bacterium]|nr:hypothetical protein [Planctomycetaceae bacterium]